MPKKLSRAQSTRIPLMCSTTALYHHHRDGYVFEQKAVGLLVLLFLLLLQCTAATIIAVSTSSYTYMFVVFSPPLFLFPWLYVFGLEEINSFGQHMDLGRWTDAAACFALQFLLCTR